MAMIVLLTNACSFNSPSVSSKLDPLTSVTITYSQPHLIFFRNASDRGADARDYIDMAPIEVNRSGNFRYFLWLGIWKTVQDAQSEQSLSDFDSVVVVADGHPLSLEIAGWTADAIGASEPVYRKPIASAADAYYEVTIDQLRLIAKAKDVRLRSTGTQREIYVPWDDQKSGKAGLIEFLDGSVY